MRILVVDDNLENLEMMTILLKSRNYQVQQAQHGQEALEILENENFDLIISDILMPVMDGFQFCRECKKNDRLKHILFVFYTATYIDKKDKEFALSLGAYRFLIKPMEPEAFLQAVGEFEEVLQSGKVKPEVSSESNEREIFKLYSERLVNKLEKKSLDLKKEIEKHKITEKRLKESEERFMLAVEGTKDGLWDLDVISGKAFFSDRYWEMLGYLPGELEPDFETWKNLIHPDDKEMAIKTVDEYLSQKRKIYESVFRMRTKEGNYLWINSRGKALLDETGRPYRFIGFHTDVTRSKEQELELIKAKEKAEESDRLKTAFLNNISHEVRTPMNGMLGFIELLRNTDVSTAVIEQYSEVIRRSSNRLLAIITDIVEISRIEAGQVTLSISSVDIDLLINSVFNSFVDQMADNTKVKISLSLHPTIKNCRCITDGEKLTGILKRLVENAIKYTPEGSIEIECEIKNSDTLGFAVKDTGLGIPKEYHELIFENFRKAENISSLELGGTGLGLSISRALVKSLGGRIWLDSEPGRGSAFYFSIPYIPVSVNNPVKE
ncbi:MAG: response regulator [Bacteroidales bacterium]|nr:response regulator [Bacteroidales bacterium]